MKHISPETFEWHIITNCQGKRTVLLLGKGYRTSSSLRVALEVTMILNPLYFLGVCVFVVCSLTCLPHVILFQQTVKLAIKKYRVTPESLSWVVNENN